jgi:hypothetical protein
MRLHDVIEGQTLVGDDLDGAVLALALLPGLGQTLEVAGLMVWVLLPFLNWMLPSLSSST